jgi:hypothetical protein
LFQRSNFGGRYAVYHDVGGNLKFTDDEDDRDVSPNFSLLASHPLDAAATPRKPLLKLVAVKALLT